MNLDSGRRLGQLGWRTKLNELARRVLRPGEVAMSVERKVALVTGASQGIGAGIVRAFVERGFNVVANSRRVTQSAEVATSDRVALVDGDVGEPATAARVVEAALTRFRSIDVLVNNAGIYFA